jgi:hypothetical protein
MFPRILAATSLVFLITLATPAEAHSQDTGRINANFSGERLNIVAMMSCIVDGEVVYQTEVQTGYGGSCMIAGEYQIPTGIYDVRVEGDGIVTEIKRGIRLTAGNTTSLQFQLRSGEGLHVVEYAVGGLSREEVAVRLAAAERKAEANGRLAASLLATPGIRQLVKGGSATPESVTRLTFPDCSEVENSIRGENGKIVYVQIGDDLYFDCEIVERNPDGSCAVDCER